MSDLLTSTLTEQLRELGATSSRIVLFTGSSLRGGRLVVPARTLVRLLGDRIVGVIDDAAGVERLADLPGWEWAPDIPVITGAAKCADVDPDGKAAIITALDLPPGKRLLGRHVEALLSLADSGRPVFSNLERTPRHPGVIDLRQVGKPERAGFEDFEPHSKRVMLYRTTSDTSAVEAASKLVASCCAAEVAADWLPSSPLGMVVRGFGRVLERSPVVFAAGLVEQLLQILEPLARVVVVEGAALMDPAALVVASAQVQGSKPTFHAVVHRALPEGDALLKDLDELLGKADGLHRSSGVRPNFLGVVLDTRALDEWAARHARSEVQKRGFTCVDLRQPDFARFVEAIDALGGASA